MIHHKLHSECRPVGRNQLCRSASVLCVDDFIPVLMPAKSAIPDCSGAIYYKYEASGGFIPL